MCVLLNSGCDVTFGLLVWHWYVCSATTFVDSLRWFYFALLFTIFARFRLEGTGVVIALFDLRHEMRHEMRNELTNELELQKLT